MFCVRFVFVEDLNFVGVVLESLLYDDDRVFGESDNLLLVQVLLGNNGCFSSFCISDPNLSCTTAPPFDMVPLLVNVLGLVLGFVVNNWLVVPSKVSDFVLELQV